MRGRIFSVISITVAAATMTGGCVQRRLTINSTPPGALLYLNGVEVGRTPMTRDFVWYGTYDVVLRHEGYQTLRTTGDVKAPWWQWVPIDFFAEFLPLHDHRTLSFAMTPHDPQADLPGPLVERAESLGSKLESSEHTQFRVTTRPATRPATRHAATTQSATTQSTQQATTESATMSSVTLIPTMGVGFAARSSMVLPMDR